MITVMSIGRKYGVDQPADIRVPALSWPSPPPAARSMDGRHPQIQAVALSNPVVADELKITADYARTLDEKFDNVTVVIECNEGIHRSVAGAEFLTAYLREVGADVEVFHRDLGRRAA